METYKSLNYFGDDEEDDDIILPNDYKKLREPFSFKVDRFIRLWKFRFVCWQTVRRAKKGTSKRWKAKK